MIILILTILAGAIVSLVASKWSNVLPRYIAMLALAIDTVLLLGSWNISAFPLLFKHGNWIFEYQVGWIHTIGANIHLAMDGLSFLMIVLTLILGFISVLASPRTDDEGFYYFNTLLMIAGVTGIFLALDLLLFFFFWEMMLVPIYLLMVMFGKNNDSKVSFKFLVYTQASGLLMLLSILCLYFIHGRNTGIYSFDYSVFLSYSYGIKAGAVIMLGFLAAFFVKLPVLPFHGWLPGSFIDAPITAVITGLLIKTGAYGIIRFVIPLFPDAFGLFANAGFVLGIITIFYGAFMAFVQDDLRLIAAYSGISHMGFILLGLYSFNEIALQGTVMQMIASAISTSALLLIASSLIKRTGTCNISQLGGLWEKSPVLSGLGMFFAFASLGLPGLGNFIAEFLILAGTFKTSIVAAVFASLGLIAAAAYSLRIIQKAFVGHKNNDFEIHDFLGIEKISLGSLVILLLWLGLYPKPVFDRSKDTVQKVLKVEAPIRDFPVKEKKNEASVKVGENKLIY
jgi:NADH-quinone oxidoreductase subunit M